MAIASAPASQEQELLDAARGGDEGAFRRIAEEHRTELLAHCYRMLGSMDDAEDMLQETLLRAWRGLPRFGGRSSLRTWLYRIATNVCLDAIGRRPKRMLPIDYGAETGAGDDVGAPLTESVWLEPFPDETLVLPHGYAAPEASYEQHEAVELAFIAALQHLPARQRAVLLLREVLGFSAREVAESLETTVASVNSALQRARKTVEERLPERSQQKTLRSLGDERIRELVEAYVDAWRTNDVDALRALLADDVVFSMPPWASWWRGSDTVADFAKATEECAGETLAIPLRANGQIALAAYHLDEATGRFEPAALDVLTLEGSLIKEITAFITPEVFARFGLPAELRK
jgi:RNA polymerase sigma-70 factor (ECF subfamily)